MLGDNGSDSTNSIASLIKQISELNLSTDTDLTDQTTKNKITTLFERLKPNLTHEFIEKLTDEQFQIFLPFFKAQILIDRIDSSGVITDASPLSAGDLNTGSAPNDENNIKGLEQRRSSRSKSIIHCRGTKPASLESLLALINSETLKNKISAFIATEIDAEDHNINYTKLNPISLMTFKQFYKDKQISENSVNNFINIQVDYYKQKIASILELFKSYLNDLSTRQLDILLVYLETNTTTCEDFFNLQLEHHQNDASLTQLQMVYNQFSYIFFNRIINPSLSNNQDSAKSSTCLILSQIIMALAACTIPHSIKDQYYINICQHLGVEKFQETYNHFLLENFSDFFEGLIKLSSSIKTSNDTNQITIDSDNALTLFKKKYTETLIEIQLAPLLIESLKHYIFKLAIEVGFIAQSDQSTFLKIFLHFNIGFSQFIEIPHQGAKKPVAAPNYIINIIDTLLKNEAPATMLSSIQQFLLKRAASKSNSHSSTNLLHDRLKGALGVADNASNLTLDQIAKAINDLDQWSQFQRQSDQNAIEFYGAHFSAAHP
ncbi:MAG: hypothetical protein KIT27_08215 [Legionellales bacterium]|nr:hypothetical protein [Legionellales bacterium]